MFTPCNILSITLFMHLYRSYSWLKAISCISSRFPFYWAWLSCSLLLQLHYKHIKVNNTHIHTIVLPLYFLFAYLSRCLYYVSMARLCGQGYTLHSSVPTASADGCFHRVRYTLGIRQSGGLHRLPSYNGKSLCICVVRVVSVYSWYSVCCILSIVHHCNTSYIYAQYPLIPILYMLIYLYIYTYSTWL